VKITVFGAGGWGTALASILTEKHGEVTLYVRNSELATIMRHGRENVRYLPGVMLPDSLQIQENMEQALAGSDLLIVATPSHGVRAAARSFAAILPRDCIVVSATKGLEMETCLRMTEVLSQELPALGGRLAALSGPNHAEEVGRRIPSASVVGCRDRAVAEYVQDAFMMPFFRIYANSDVAGVELGGALKNVIALACGIGEGLGFGDNSKAALMTRGLAEIARLGSVCGADIATFSGLSGVGDLIATCTSPHSRNRRAGIEIAKGRTIDEIQSASNMVIEGVRATTAALDLAGKKGVEMPITESLQQVLYGGLSPRSAVLELMTRSKKHETEEVAFPSSFNKRG
jgi:glycerol-3-phosphate dehydrogenase (NAD(P)+)